MILCKNILICPINETKHSISWELDINQIKAYLKEQYNIEKIYNFQEQLDYYIEIDNVSTFDSINKKVYTFKNTNYEIGKIVQSCIIEFIPQLEKTSFYIRIKIIDNNYNFNVKINNEITNINVNINNDYSEIYNINIDKNYTLDIIKSMYNGIPDSNAYSKGSYDANFYYILQCFAIQDNNLFNTLNIIKNGFFVNRCKPDDLSDNFGGILGYYKPNNITNEEYRRIIIELYKSLQNIGTTYSILNPIKYLVGDNCEIINFKNIYPWILRSKNYQQNYDNPNLITDPIDSNYTNKSSNYYLYNEEKIEVATRKNKIMLLDKNFKLFCYEIISDNFFNNEIDDDAIYSIINKLKPLYMKYFLNINKQEEIVEE